MREMNKVSKLFILLFGFLVLTSFQSPNNSQNLKITVEIDFGQNSEIQKYSVQKEKNISALEALQLTSNIETKVIKGNVIVISVNGVKSEPGKTAWYYKVNGKMASVLAINNQLKDRDIVNWVFQEDVCTKTVKKQ
jgi:hypothetical protein